MRASHSRVRIQRRAFRLTLPICLKLSPWAQTGAFGREIWDLLDLCATGWDGGEKCHGREMEIRRAVCVTVLTEKYVIGLGCGVPCTYEPASKLDWNNAAHIHKGVAPEETVANRGDTNLKKIPGLPNPFISTGVPILPHPWPRTLFLVPRVVPVSSPGRLPRVWDRQH